MSDKTDWGYRRNDNSVAHRWKKRHDLGSYRWQPRCTGKRTESAACYGVVFCHDGPPPESHQCEKCRSLKR